MILGLMIGFLGYFMRSLVIGVSIAVFMWVVSQHQENLKSMCPTFLVVWLLLIDLELNELTEGTTLEI